MEKATTERRADGREHTSLGTALTEGELRVITGAKDDAAAEHDLLTEPLPDGAGSPGTGTIVMQKTREGYIRLGIALDPGCIGWVTDRMKPGSGGSGDRKRLRNEGRGLLIRSTVERLRAVEDRDRHALRWTVGEATWDDAMKKNLPALRAKLREIRGRIAEVEAGEREADPDGPLDGDSGNGAGGGSGSCQAEDDPAPHREAMQYAAGRLRLLAQETGLSGTHAETAWRMLADGIDPAVDTRRRFMALGTLRNTIADLEECI